MIPVLEELNGEMTQVSLQMADREQACDWVSPRCFWTDPQTCS